MRLVLCLLVMSVATSAADEIYRWTDATGRTHYGDASPVTTQAERLDPAQLPYLNNQPRLHNQPRKPSSAASGSPPPQQSGKAYRLSGTAPAAPLEACKRQKRKVISAQRAKRHQQTEALEDWLWKNCRTWSFELRKLDQAAM